uniref:Topoisomerase 6 subunit A/Spo11 TOPRIM domain-containing protein n=1 Tax=Romanomermis culicivorax TaxID=13658 RepID=A0A915I1K1_ROMCU
MGDLMFRLKDGVAVDCNIAPTQVPPVVDDITEVVSNAKFILIVEKETIFQRLQDEEFCSQFYPCMMITAKGYPDYATRQMLQLLLDSLQIPMYVLVDGDPYGIDIYLTYRFGSSNNDCDINVNNVNLNCIQWLGVLPSEISRLNFPKDQYLALTDREKSKLRCMSDRASEFADERFLVDQLQIMLELGLKVELEALCSLEASYLSQVYLRSKLAGLFESAPVSQSH